MDTLRDIMTPDPMTLDAGMSLREAVEMLRAAGVSGAPVVKGQRVVGVVSATDVLELAVSAPGVPVERPEMSEIDDPDAAAGPVDQAPSSYFAERWLDTESDVWTRISETDAPEWDRLEEYGLEEVMTYQLISLPPEATIGEGARTMVREQVHRVLVVDDDELVGLVSAFDIVRAVANSADADAQSKSTSGR